MGRLRCMTVREPSSDVALTLLPQLSCPSPRSSATTRDDLPPRYRRATPSPIATSTRLALFSRRRDRRESFALYAVGLFSDAERKSVEPIAAMACGDEELCRAYHDQLLHFVGVSPWSDRDVRSCASRYALSAMTVQETVDDWIIDDTGFPKQGNKSPGVQRQYSGTLGKTGNCQIGVSVTIATPTLHLPIDMDLYLPRSWTDDRARCRAAHIPDDVGYRPKWQIALDLIRRNVEAGVPVGLMLADSGYGDVGDFRAGVRALGFDYALDVKKHTRVVIACDDGCETDPMSVETVSEIVGEDSYRKVTWREGSRRALSARFATLRVRPVTDNDTPRRRTVARHRQGQTRRRRRALRPGHAAQDDVVQAARPTDQATLAHRASVRRSQGRAGPRPLRGTHLHRLATPRQLCPLLLRLPRR